MHTSNRVFALIPCSLAGPKPWPTAEAMELNSAISRHLIYRAIYILTQLAAPGVRRGINPPARPGDYRRGTKGIVTKHLADANGGSRRILRPDCRSGIFRICWKIDCQGELNRLRTINHRRVAIDRYGCSTY